MKECSLVNIDIKRAAGTVAEISEDNQLIATHVTHLMNTVALTRAMQAGYRMACLDNGLPVPDMEDPRTLFGLGGVR